MERVEQFTTIIQSINDETNTMVRFLEDDKLKPIYRKHINSFVTKAEILLQDLKQRNKLASLQSVNPETTLYWGTINSILRQILNNYTTLEKYGLSKNDKEYIEVVLNTPLDQLENIQTQQGIFVMMEDSFKILMNDMSSIYSFRKKETVTPQFVCSSMKQISDLFVEMKGPVDATNKKVDILQLIEKIVLSYRDITTHFVDLTKTFHMLG